MKPDSSSKTIERLLRRAFFYTRPILAAPLVDGRLIVLSGTSFWLLAAPI
jgi:hypothetical protein